MSKYDNRVTFRLLDPKHLRDLQALADGRGLSAGDLAREIVVKSLEGKDQTVQMLHELRNQLAELRKEVQRLTERADADHKGVEDWSSEDDRIESELKIIHQAIREIRGTIGTAAAAILVEAAKFAPEAATEWVEKVLLAKQ